MAIEDEFSRRDASGLTPTFIHGAQSSTQAESATRQGLFKKIGVIYFVIAPLLALVLLWGMCKLSPTSSDQYAERMELMRKYDLGWLYAAVYILNLTRTYASINAIGARAAARVDRPDQHAYRIMANPQCKDGHSKLSDAPYVLMENVGPAGRFNRAQRAAFHFDEGLELLLSTIFLVGVVVPQLVFGLTAVYCVNRKMYTDVYTGSLGGRMDFYQLVVLPSAILGAMLGMFAVQSLVM